MLQTQVSMEARQEPTFLSWAESVTGEQIDALPQWGDKKWGVGDEVEGGYYRVPAIETCEEQI